MNVGALGRASRLAAIWSLGYGLYRSYYALGGTIGMHGTPVSFAQWRRINGIGAVMLLATAVLLLWAAIAWAGALQDSPRRLWWVGSAVAATIASTTVGLLSAFGVIGRVIIG